MRVPLRGCGLGSVRPERDCLYGPQPPEQLKQIKRGLLKGLTCPAEKFEDMRGQRSQSRGVPVNALCVPGADVRFRLSPQCPVQPLCGDSSA